MLWCVILPPMVLVPVSSSSPALSGVQNSSNSAATKAGEPPAKVAASLQETVAIHCDSGEKFGDPGMRSDGMLPPAPAVRLGGGSPFSAFPLAPLPINQLPEPPPYSSDRPWFDCGHQVLSPSKHPALAYIPNSRKIHHKSNPNLCPSPRPNTKPNPNKAHPMRPTQTYYLWVELLKKKGMLRKRLLLFKDQLMLIWKDWKWKGWMQGLGLVSRLH